MGLSKALQDRLAAAAEAGLVTQAAVQAPVHSRVLDDVTARYRWLALQLQTVLEDETARDRTRQLLADMLDQVVIGSDSATSETFAELNEPAERRSLAAIGELLEVVAGARNVNRKRL